MMLGVQNEIETIKQTLKQALMQGDLPKVRVAFQTMQNQNLSLSFIEQMTLLGDLATLDAKVGYAILNCGAFRQELILVGMTCLNNFKGTESPFTIPLVERELADAANQERFSDVHLILDIAKWCINPVIRDWAKNKAAGASLATYDDVRGVEYMAKYYLPMAATNRMNQQKVMNQSGASAKNTKRLTM